MALLQTKSLSETEALCFTMFKTIHPPSTLTEAFPNIYFAANNCYLKSFSSASFVPSTRALIFAKAVSRVVDTSSQKGENPQSSVVPN